MGKFYMAVAAKMASNNQSYESVPFNNHFLTSQKMISNSDSTKANMRLHDTLWSLAITNIHCDQFKAFLKKIKLVTCFCKLEAMNKSSRGKR